MSTGGGDCNNYATYNKVKYLTNMSELRLLSPRQVVMLAKVVCTKWMMRSDIHADEPTSRWHGSSWFSRSGSLHLYFGHIGANIGAQRPHTHD